MALTRQKKSNKPPTASTSTVPAAKKTASTAKPSKKTLATKAVHQSQAVTDKKAPIPTTGCKGSAKTSAKATPHPIAAAIDRCISRISDIRYSLNHVMSYAIKSRTDEIKAAQTDIHTHLKALKHSGGAGGSNALAIKTIIEASSRLIRFEQSELLNILGTGHFLTLFSSFDAFTGELLTAIYKKKPDLYSKLNRSMTVAEMLQYSNVEDIKEIVLKSEIESVRRKSYVEQFEMLEVQFGLPLTKFDRWSSFVECAQRRNLFTHCDGYVSDQYISVCKKHGCALPDDVREGVRLQLDPHYLVRACSLTIEVALKLGQTLWRKVFPGELEDADNHLQTAQYDFLTRDEWFCARMAGDFALSLPKHSSSVLKTIMAVNLAISLHRCNEKEKAATVLNSIDWTALCYDFRLAEQVLRHDYQKAKELMIKIGKRGEFVEEHVYHTWPLFWEFRQSEEFAQAYRSIYGYDFADKLRSSASDSEKKAEHDLKQEEESAILLASAKPEEDECPPHQTPADAVLKAAPGE